MSRGKEMRADELARRLASIADDKKGTDLVALDVRSLHVLGRVEVVYLARHP